MFERMAEFETMLSADGRWYRPKVFGNQTADGTWDGFIVFFPLGVGNVISTPRETTQSSGAAIREWALTLDQVYLEGALARALNASAGVPVVGSLSDLAVAESTAAADAAALHHAADRVAAEVSSAAAVAEMHDRAAAVARENAAELERERQEIESLADEATRADAEAAAAGHESAARTALAIARDAAPRKARKRPASSRRKKPE
jgi:hypothetical protein